MKAKPRAATDLCCSSSGLCQALQVNELALMVRAPALKAFELIDVSQRQGGTLAASLICHCLAN